MVAFGCPNPIFWGECNSVPGDYEHLSFFIGRTPDKVSLDSIYKLVDLFSNGDELHDVILGAIKRGFGKGSSLSHVQEFDLSTTKLSIKEI